MRTKQTTFDKVRIGTIFLFATQSFDKVSTTTARPLANSRAIKVFPLTETVDEEIVFGDYTETELHEAFDKVKSPKGWKYPIRATIDEKDMDVVDYAIGFFAGGGTSFGTPKNGKVKVTAPGYYAIIGA